MNCPSCQMILMSTLMSPPHLIAEPTLPIYLTGHWVSQSCESHPYAIFLKRTLKFPVGNRWIGTFTYYSDSKCKDPTYRVVARGSFIEKGPSAQVPGGNEFDFRLTSATLTPLNKWTVKNLNGHLGDVCGLRGSWRANQSQELTATYGCKGLGLKIPSTEYDLVKVEFDSKGELLLFLGQPHTIPNRKARPTSYQAGLIQCSEVAYEENEEPNEIQAINNARLFLASGSISGFKGTHFNAYLLVSRFVLVYLLCFSFSI